MIGLETGWPCRENRFSSQVKSELEYTLAMASGRPSLSLCATFLLLNVCAMLIAWCSDIWKPPAGWQFAQAFLMPEYLKLSHLICREEIHSDQTEFSFCYLPVGLESHSEVWWSTFGLSEVSASSHLHLPDLHI